MRELELRLVPVRCVAPTAPELTFSPNCGSSDPITGLSSIRELFSDMLCQSNFLEAVLIDFLECDRDRSNVRIDCDVEVVYHGFSIENRIIGVQKSVR